MVYICSNYTFVEIIYGIYALIIQEVVTDQHRMKYERVKEQIAFMMRVMSSLQQIGQNFEERTRSFGDDMKQFGKELA